MRDWALYSRCKGQMKRAAVVSLESGRLQPSRCDAGPTMVVQAGVALEGGRIDGPRRRQYSRIFLRTVQRMARFQKVSDGRSMVVDRNDSIT